MIEIQEIRIPCGAGREALEKKLRRLLRLGRDEPFTWRIARHGIDARKRPQLMDVYTVEVSLRGKSAEQERKRAERAGEKQIRSSFDGRGKDAAELSNSVRISDIQDQHFRGSAGQSPGNIRNNFCWQVLDFTVFVKVIIVMLGQHFSIRVSLNVDSKAGSIIEAKPHEICRERAEEN